MFTFLSLTKFKVMVSFVILILVLLFGFITVVCKSCPIGVVGWHCGCNPLFGLMPWAVFIPPALVFSYIIAVITNSILKK